MKKYGKSTDIKPLNAKYGSVFTNELGEVFIKVPTSTLLNNWEKLKNFNDATHQKNFIKTIDQKTVLTDADFNLAASYKNLLVNNTGVRNFTLGELLSDNLNKTLLLQSAIDYNLFVNSTDNIFIEGESDVFNGSGIMISNKNIVEAWKEDADNWFLKGNFTKMYYSPANAINPVNTANTLDNITVDVPTECNLSIQEGDNQVGDYFVRVSATGVGSEYSITIQCDNLEIGETYKVSILAKQPVGTNAGVYWSDGFAENGIIGTNIPSNTDVWVERTENSVANATSCNFGIYSAANTSGNYIDIARIIIEKVS